MNNLTKGTWVQVFQNTPDERFNHIHKPGTIGAIGDYEVSNRQLTNTSDKKGAFYVRMSDVRPLQYFISSKAVEDIRGPKYRQFIAYLNKIGGEGGGNFMGGVSDYYGVYSPDPTNMSKVVAFAKDSHHKLPPGVVEITLDEWVDLKYDTITFDAPKVQGTTAPTSADTGSGEAHSAIKVWQSEKKGPVREPEYRLSRKQLIELNGINKLGACKTLKHIINGYLEQLVYMSDEATVIIHKHHIDRFDELSSKQRDILAQYMKLPVKPKTYVKGDLFKINVTDATYVLAAINGRYILINIHSGTNWNDGIKKYGVFTESDLKEMCGKYSVQHLAGAKLTVTE